VGRAVGDSSMRVPLPATPGQYATGCDPAYSMSCDAVWRCRIYLSSGLMFSRSLATKARRREAVELFSSLGVGLKTPGGLKTGRGGVEWIEVARGAYQLRAVENTVMNLAVPQNVGKFRSRLATSSFSRTA
jgi:hypothetical protein